MLLVAWSVAAFAQDLVVDGTTTDLSGAHVYDTVRIVNGGVLHVTPYNGAGTTGTLDLTATRVIIDATSRIDGTGSGFTGVVNNPGSGTGGGGAAAAAGGGGGHGGDGDDGSTGDCLTASGTGGATNGVVDPATERGSGGGAPQGSGIAGGTGGASIRIDAAVIDLRGRIEADGLNGPVSAGGEGAGGGAGGGITLVADALYCTGVLSARGGSGGSGTAGNGGGGAGGRIERYSDRVGEDCITRVNPGRDGCGPLAEAGTDDDLQDEDYDGDGLTVAAGDCDGADPDVFVGAVEVCDGWDNDCDADVDEGVVCAGFTRKNVNGRVYQFNTSQQSWTNAQSACATIGYTLAEIEDSAENSSFASNADMVSNNNEWWIGYNDRTTEGTFVWDGGAPYTYDNFQGGNSNGSDCVLFDDNNRWSYRSCNDTEDYACEICETDSVWYPDVDGDGFGDRTSPIRTCYPTAGQTTDAEDCNDDADTESPDATSDACNAIDDDCDGIGDEGCTCFADTFDGHDYELCTSLVTWDAARAICERKGKTLATIDTSAESVWLGTAVDARSTLPWFVGLDDLDGDSAFTWTFGSPAFDAFGGTEPNGTGDCVVLNAPTVGDDEWADEVCATPRRFVCEEIDGCTPTLWHRDADGDGWGSDTVLVSACDLPAGYVVDGGDCNDAASGVNPDATESTADGIDQDCDGGDRCYRDDDGDEHGSTLGLASADLDCADAGESEVNDDCDDDDDTVFTGAPETCGDGEDSNCDGNGGPDSDEDGDQLPWSVEGPVGGNDCAIDTDLDGILDEIEILRDDTDLDGTYDIADVDDDDDTILTSIEGIGTGECTGVDDGLPNYLDGDSDGDGLPDFEEGTFDTDADGFGDYIDCTNECDFDADGDGIEVCDETGLGTDPNSVDSDGDGIGDLDEVVNVNNPRDTDSDGLIDAIDADDDGDTVDTIVEDHDGDGDPRNDDTDLDTVADYFDVDDDGDGTDTKDEDRDGDGDPRTDDSDGDTVPDYVDDKDWDGPNADIDGDGLANGVETAIGSDPADFDSDGDSVRDGDEVGDPASPRDTDDDGLPDLLDADDDGDGVDTVLEGLSDVDGDGLPNALDPDSDDDGTPDGGESVEADVDCDLIVDRYDPVDGDGCAVVDDDRRVYESAGCGCSQSTGRVGWWFVAGILLWRRKRAR